jgi:hypothetical protein
MHKLRRQAANTDRCSSERAFAKLSVIVTLKLSFSIEPSNLDALSLTRERVGVGLIYFEQLLRPWGTIAIRNVKTPERHSGKAWLTTPIRLQRNSPLNLSKRRLRLDNLSRVKSCGPNRLPAPGRSSSRCLRTPDRLRCRSVATAPAHVPMRSALRAPG